jgi:ATP-dependent Clp protease ATP-binding subunit ClpA
VQLPPPSGEALALVPFSGPAKKVMELTFLEALRLGHNYIGTEHLLLALLESEDPDGLLHRAGVDKAKAEADLAGMLKSISANLKA